MKHRCRQWIGLLLCFVLLIGMLPTGMTAEQIHFHDNEGYEISDHKHDVHPVEESPVLSVCEDIFGELLGLFALPVSAAYEDGVACDYCGSWRYDDWKCDNGDHCGEGSGTSCYEEHHCGYCGACDDDHELCDDCGNCLEDHCECEEKCRGCYEMGETVCSDCGEKCSGCDWICDECGKCTDCIGDETHCSYCDVCIECADWICYCGEGCSRCAIGCPDCYEVCSSCSGDDAFCHECWHCFDCLGGEGNYCTECCLCVNCVERLCYCGNGCSECTLVCPECNEQCENCADGICGACGICDNCVGGEGNYCYNCDQCKYCVTYICICGEGCSECADEICPECGEKCTNCADDELCSQCGVCFDCVGGDGNFCEECGECKNCVDQVCICGGGCSQCTVICEECGETCGQCGEDELCTECGICIDCADAFCIVCRKCSDCTESICECGEGCSECAELCPDCGQKCSSCSEDVLCADCGLCIDCVGEDNFCVNCGLCGSCVDVICACGEGCGNCADLCPECEEVCSSCCDTFCASCDLCINCVDELLCEDCLLCGDCTDLCEDCGVICHDCAENSCPDCGRCADCMDEYCPDCGICLDCADAMCQDCHYCGDCAAVCDDCRDYCSGCAAFCEECGICEFCQDSSPNCDHDVSDRPMDCKSAGGHKLAEAVITRKPGYTYSGEKQSSCIFCDYVLTEALPKLTVPQHKYVIVLPMDAVTSQDGEPIRELLSKGTKAVVPALPELTLNAEGRRFTGWVDKKTGKPVQKGDPMTGNIEIVPVWSGNADLSKIPFTDVKVNDYFASAVAWAYENNITAGTSDTTFSPDMTCTRAQVVTFLWRAAGCPEPKTAKNPFRDVKNTDWYYKAVLWAVEQNITQGTSETTFTPTRDCSTAEILTFLFRSVGAGTNGYYEEAAKWAASRNLVQVTGLNVNPTTPCPRKAIVTYLYGIYG